MKFIFISISAILLMATALGDFRSVTFSVGNSMETDSFDVELYAKTQDYESLLREAMIETSGLTDPRSIALKLLEVSDNRALHLADGPGEHTIFSNWMLYGLGFVHPAFRARRSLDNLLFNNQSFFCSQVSFVLHNLLIDHAIPSRHVGLFGHVVVEAYWDSSWHMLDPDFGVYVDGGNGDILSVSELTPELIEQAYRDNVSDANLMQTIIGIFLDQRRHNYVAYPERAYYTSSAQLLQMFEIATNILKWVFPILILIGCTLQTLFRMKRR